MRLNVELFGPPRTRANAKDVCVEVPDEATLGDLIASLARQAPGLVGSVIAAERDRLLEPYTFYVEGHGFVGDAAIRLEQSSRVSIMMASVGG